MAFDPEAGDPYGRHKSGDYRNHDDWGLYHRSTAPADYDSLATTLQRNNVQARPENLWDATRSPGLGPDNMLRAPGPHPDPEHFYRVLNRAQFFQPDKFESFVQKPSVKAFHPLVAGFPEGDLREHAGELGVQGPQTPSGPMSLPGRD